MKGRTVKRQTRLDLIPDEQLGAEIAYVLGANHTRPRRLRGVRRAWRSARAAWRCSKIARAAQKRSRRD